MQNRRSGEAVWQVLPTEQVENARRRQCSLECVCGDDFVLDRGALMNQRTIVLCCSLTWPLSLISLTQGLVTRLLN